jgi:hypothetical protein
MVGLLTYEISANNECFCLWYWVVGYLSERTLSMGGQAALMKV